VAPESAAPPEALGIGRKSRCTSRRPPQWIGVDDIPAAVIGEARGARRQARTRAAAEIVEKIVEGRMRRFSGDRLGLQPLC
jgi:translation elongation factor EF-Ts